MELFSIGWWGHIVAGIGLFLYGMSFLGESLRALAGNKLKKIIDKCTSNAFLGLLVGILITAIFQSSMATTLLAIGLISVGLMNIKQAIGVIMGANIGTTVTGFIIGLNLAEFSPFFVLAGVILIVFFNKQLLHNLGNVLLSFGLLFFGLSLVEGCLKELATNQDFINILINVGDSPWLSLIAGTIGTILVQSSSAFVGVVQSLYNAASSTNYTLAMTIPLILGSCIGTSLSCMFLSLNKGVQARRAGSVHVFFNMFGAIIVMIILTPFSNLMTSITTSLNPMMQVAVVNIIFKVTTTIVLFPFINQIAKIVVKLFKDKNNEIIEVDLSVLDNDILEISPATALTIAKEQTVIMADYAKESIDTLLNYFNNRNDDDRKKVLKNEATIDMFNERLTDFFHRLDDVQLSQSEMYIYGEVMKTFRDIERISDHCENLAEYFNEFFAANEELHKESQKDICDMFNLVSRMIVISIDQFKNDDASDSFELNGLEEKLDNLNREARNRYVNRLAKKQDKGNKYITVVYADIIANIERIGDHCTNISENVKEAKRSSYKLLLS